VACHEEQPLHEQMKISSNWVEFKKFLIEKMNCLFCNLPTDRIIFQNEFAMMIEDAYPISRGHCLIIPKRHVGSWFSTNVEEQSSILQLLSEAKNRQDKEYQPASYNIGINDGQAAGQTVPHLHVHLIPRYQEDKVDPRGGVRWIIPEKAKYWE
jgi:diadenosine tetraphosphate (Ap4A) HIT family hydrolase